MISPNQFALVEKKKRKKVLFTFIKWHKFMDA